MNEDFCPEARIAWEPFLKEQALTEIEFSLLDEIFMTQDMPAERLIPWTLQEIRTPVTEPRAEVELAVRALLDRGLLLEIDETCLAAIHLLLARSHLVPTLGWPRVGSLDLSLRGAAVMKRWRELVFGPVPQGSAVRVMQAGSPVIVFGTDEEAIADFLDADLKTDETFLEAGEITPCGIWCGRWWQVYSNGFVCEVKMRDPDES
jgi:hypothetical protein